MNILKAVDTYWQMALLNHSTNYYTPQQWMKLPGGSQTSQSLLI